MFRIFFLLGLILLSSCDSQINDFQQSLKRDYELFTPKQKGIFNTLYTYDSAEKEALEYCQLLKSGKTEESLADEKRQNLLDLISKKEITNEEAVDVTSVKNVVSDLAVIIYCPEFNKTTPSLKERLNKK